MKTKVIIAIILSVFCLSCRQDGPSEDALPKADFSPSFVQITGDEACAMAWNESDSLQAWYRDGLWSVYFPWSKLLGTDPEWVGVRIPAVQKAVSGICPLRDYGFWTAVSDGKSKELLLKPGFSVLKLVFEASNTALSDKSLTSVKADVDGTVSGNAIVNVSDGSIIVAPSGSKLTLQPEDSLSLGEKLSVYAVVWPGSISGMNLDVPCTQKFHLGVVLDTAITFKAGQCHEMEIGIERLLADGKAVIDVEKTDLSASGTANCYVVPASGYYKFKAVRGNSPVVPSGLSKVDWLWKDTADELTDDIELGIDGYVSFWASARKGNEILAGFNDAGDIVWSWHLWFTDDPAKNAGYGKAAQYRVLDRNLGATMSHPDSLASYGFYYQWGRKDPFIGSSTRGYNVATKRIETTGFSSATAAYYVNPDYAAHSFVTVANTTLPDGGEIDWLIKHPMTFVTGTSWFYDASSMTANKGLWGWDGNKGYVKSSYDPCPPGWKIPANPGGEEFADLNFAICSTDLMGTVYTGVNESKTYFPATGSRDNVGGYITYAGWTGRYWGALYREKTKDCWALSIDGYTDENNPFNPRQVHIAGSFGASVRCVKE